MYLAIYWQSGVLCIPGLAVLRVCVYGFLGTAKPCLYSLLVLCQLLKNLVSARNTQQASLKEGNVLTPLGKAVLSGPAGKAAAGVPC